MSNVTDTMVEAALDAYYHSSEWKDSKDRRFCMNSMRRALEASEMSEVSKADVARRTQMTELQWVTAEREKLAAMVRELLPWIDERVNLGNDRDCHCGDCFQVRFDAERARALLADIDTRNLQKMQSAPGSSIELIHGRRKFASKEDEWFAWCPVRIGALGTGPWRWLVRLWRNRGNPGDR